MQLQSQHVESTTPHTAGADFCTWMLPQWKDQQIRSVANNGKVHAMERLEEASHCRQTCMVVNV